MYAVSRTGPKSTCAVTHDVFLYQLSLCTLPSSSILALFSSYFIASLRSGPCVLAHLCILLPNIEYVHSSPAKLATSNYPGPGASTHLGPQPIAKRKARWALQERRCCWRAERAKIRPPLGNYFPRKVGAMMLGECNLGGSEFQSELSLNGVSCFQIKRWTQRESASRVP